MSDWRPNAFFGTGWDLWEGVPRCLFDGLCHGVCLYGRLSVTDFNEVEQVRIVSLVQGGATDVCSFGSPFVCKFVCSFIAPYLRVALDPVPLDNILLSDLFVQDLQYLHKLLVVFGCP